MTVGGAGGVATYTGGRYAAAAAAAVAAMPQSTVRYACRLAIPANDNGVQGMPMISIKCDTGPAAFGSWPLMTVTSFNNSSLCP
jgi:hypothetical protein